MNHFYQKQNDLSIKKENKRVKKRLGECSADILFSTFFLNEKVVKSFQNKFGINLSLQHEMDYQNHKLLCERLKRK